LPYVSICLSALSSQELIIMVSTRMEITGPHPANCTSDCLCTSGTLWPILPTVNTLVPSDFHYFASFASPKQAVTCHQAPDTNCLCVRIQDFGSHVTNFSYQWYLLGGLGCTICYNVPCIHQGQQNVLCIKVFVTQNFIFLCSFVLILLYRWMCGM
jgi:hypothetical protein